MAVSNLKRSIGYKEMVEANFASFAVFARHQQQQDVKLIVVEGQVHPKARAAYDIDGLQQTTRKRLRKMATEYGFQYFDNPQMPSFTADDFADAYHLNQQGRIKLSSFLSEKLTNMESHQSSEIKMTDN